MLMNYIVVLSIAGSDSSGGAGIQADIKTMSAIGVFATTAITAITAQNTTGVTAIQGISPDVVVAQIDAVFTDMPPAAVKIGMLFSAEIANVVANRLRYHRSANIILDPVMVSTSGSKLIADDAIETIKRDLFPIAEILTPNRFEAELLSGVKLSSPKHCGEAAAKILEFGGKYVLIKGGHFDGKKMIDYLFDRNGIAVERDLVVSGVGSGVVESLPISIPFAETMSIDQQESVPAEVESITKFILVCLLFSPFISCRSRLKAHFPIHVNIYILICNTFSAKKMI
nr:unnamed protein product [uncultured bacterium]